MKGIGESVDRVIGGSENQSQTRLKPFFRMVYPLVVAGQLRRKLGEQQSRFLPSARKLTSGQATQPYDRAEENARSLYGRFGMTNLRVGREDTADSKMA